MCIKLRSILCPICNFSVLHLWWVNWRFVSFFSCWVCVWIIWLISSSLTIASMKITSKLKDDKLLNFYLLLSFLPDAFSVASFIHSLVTRLRVFVCVCVWPRLCVLVMDRMQECNTGWQKERGRHSKVYKIIWSSSAFLCTVRLCSSIPLHPPPHQVLDQELWWLSLCCQACQRICLPLVILTAVEWFFIVYPGMMIHMMKRSCDFVSWMLSLFL